MTTIVLSPTPETMPALATDLRKQLENVCIQARDLAEAAARSALQKRAVDVPEPFTHFSAADKELRNRLRARGRQMGDVRHANKTQAIDQLTQELAYEYWHRMLFARFLAENNLLINTEGVAVSLEECEELAKTVDVTLRVTGDGTHHAERDVYGGAPNGFVLAARYASRMLPQIFRTDDVLLEIEFPAEQRLTLERLLASLPKETFLADDSLGWVYQFWQSKRKDQVNAAGAKIDATTLSAVTQLFTEHYMVEFLLHNTIGAWWVAKEGVGPRIKHGSNTDGKREYANGIDPSSIRAPSVALSDFEYLRWRDDGTPAAGTFDGWPRRAAELKVLDPCCGSGHFLVAAFNLLVPLRMVEMTQASGGRQPPVSEVVDAVLRDNLFGLELDPRCTQIAAFALALAAWRYPDRSHHAPRDEDRSHHAPRDETVTRSVTSTVEPLGYRELPPLNIACVGIGPQAGEDEWLKLAQQSGRPMNALSREPILDGLRNLHALFSNAPTLGSLIDPNQMSADLITADYRTLQPYLAAALAADDRSHADRSHHAPRDGTVTRSVTSTMDDDARQRAVAAQGMAKAAELLAGEYTLVVTNVPYLGRGKQDETLKSYLEKHYAEGKADLATAFVLRCLEFCAGGGTAALVTPQNWLFLTSYTRLRQRLLEDRTWNAVARLGERAFESDAAAGAFVAMPMLSATGPGDDNMVVGLDASGERDSSEKAKALCQKRLMLVSQKSQFANPDAAIRMEVVSGKLLSEHASSTQGLKTGDDERWRRFFWEIWRDGARWRLLQSTVETTIAFGGKESVIDWAGRGEQMARLQGMAAWGSAGVAVKLMRSLPVTLYTGEVFDSNVSPVVPYQRDLLPAIWCFCESGDLAKGIRKVNTKLNIAEGSLVKIPFDLAHWQQVAAEKYPNGLPEPESDDPTQWLFHGRPEQSTGPLQVAVARMLGYRWPAELDASMRLSRRARELVERCDELVPFADANGLVPISSVRGEPPAAERLLELLRATVGISLREMNPHAEREVYDGRDDYGVLLERALGDAGCKPGTSLDDWLRNQFFEQHCKLFHNRPFIWHIWDGRKDGFSCLVNYHKLNHKTLENLTYSYLGDWIAAQAAEAKADRTGAGLRLAAAQALQAKLKLILAGEPPYDIFVRWKPLSEQAIGWHPELNDGVRMNIRPFIEADILRKKPNIKWTKDRGKEPGRDKAEYPWFWKGEAFVGDRVNDVHFTNAEKQAARSKK